jgi:hypothetical protein
MILFKLYKFKCKKLLSANATTEVLKPLYKIPLKISLQSLILVIDFVLLHISEESKILKRSTYSL